MGDNYIGGESLLGVGTKSMVPFGRRSFLTAAILLVALVGSVIWSMRVYESSNPGPPISGFDGSVEVVQDPPESFKFVPVQVSVKVGNADGLERASDRFSDSRDIEIHVASKSGYLELYSEQWSIDIGGDARISQVRAASWMHNERDGDAPSLIRETIPDGRGSPGTERFTVKFPEGYRPRSSFALLGTMERSVGVKRGSETALRLPKCVVVELDSSCDIDAGEVSDGGDVIFSSASLENPGQLTWSFNRADFPPDSAPALGPISVRLQDGEAEKAEQDRTFVAGAMIGVAANAGIELLLLSVGAGLAALAWYENRRRRAEGPSPTRRRTRPLLGSREPTVRITARRRRSAGSRRQ